ncbi:CotH kinase family protein [Akkermansiaceae bacterium]|nr:CotH kinase family protein [Akkermansiaceae bacterium]
MFPLPKIFARLSCFLLAGGSALADLPGEITSQGTASQTHSHTSGLYPPGQAIDGDLTTFNHTESSSPGAAWELHFPDEREVSSVEIVSRDCCAGRLNGATLRLFDGEAEMVFEIAIVDSGPLTTFNATIPENTMVRNLRIGFEPGQSGIVHLAEVRVFAPAGDPPQIDHFEASGNDLSWSVSNADSVELYGFGAVTSTGSMTVSPTESTAYFLSATNACDTITASAPVTINGIPLPPLINEFNATGEDWVEIWNRGNTLLSLDGWHLTDDPENLQRWRFPAGQSIVPGGLLTVTEPFGIAREAGSFLALIDPGGQIVSQFTYPQQFEGSSYGFDLEGNETYLLEPSPGEFNIGPSVSGFLQGVNFSSMRGLYTDSFSLTLSPKTPGAAVLYSLDASDPSLEYTAPLTIDRTTVVRAIEVLDGFDPPRPEAHTFLFPADIATQPDFPTGFPTDWLPDTASGALAPIPRRTDYEMDPEIVNAAPFDDRQGEKFDIPKALTSLPSLCLTLPNEEMWDPADGLHANALKRGRPWEREISMEVIDLESGEHFHTGCGLRIHGGRGRVAEMLKKSFRLYFRGDYGATKFDYPLFDGMPEGGVDHLVLRGGNGKTWASPWRDLTGGGNSLPRVTYLRDQFLRDTNRAMEQPSFAGTFAHLYINGIYWGLYNPIERPGGPYAANHFGGDADTDWDFLKWANGLPTQVVSGDTDAWNEVLALSRSNPAANYAAIEERVDIDNLADFLISNFYVGNIDWVGTRNNGYAFRSRTGLPDRKFRFMCWDGEESLLNTGANSTDTTRETTTMELHLDLRTVPEYRLRFADRVHRHLVDEDGVLQTPLGTARHDALADLVDEGIAAESARWGDLLRPDNPYTYEGDWTTEIANITNNYLTTRPATTLSQLRADNLYPDTVAPVANLTEAGTFTLTAPQGTIWFTIDGSDPIDSPTAATYDATASSGTLIALDDDWAYLDNGSDLSGTEWTSVAYNAQDWSNGSAPLGYGGITGTTIATQIDFGGDSNNKHLTSYFRRDFVTIDPSNVGTLLIRYMRDDGAVIYLNGTEIERSNLPAGPINASTTALESVGGNDEASLIEVAVPVGLIVSGTNTIAVEVHQNRGNSSDLVFALELIEIRDGIPLTGDTRVKARTLSGGEWSALEDETFRLGDSPPELVVSELMYHPAPPSVSEIAAGFSNDDEFEFIEIGNVSGKTLLLDGIRFTKGIDMTLEGSLPPGAAALLVANREAFEFRYGDGFNILGEWQNGDRLDNGGELIRLRDARNRIIQEFTYDDRGLWPQSPDGNGPSLVLIAPASFPNHDLAGNWRPSSTPGGNPGGSDATTFPGGTSAELLAYATRGDLQREVLPDGNYAFTLDRNLLADDVIIHLETSTDLQEWHNASDIFSRSALGPLDGSFSKVTFTTTEAPNSPRFFLRYRIELR